MPRDGRSSRFTEPSSAGDVQARRVRVSHRAALALNIAPMIDIVFLLLIFFVLGTTFKSPEGLFTATMPKDAGTAPAALPISPIVVRVSQFGPADADVSIRIENFTRAPQGFADLARFLADIQQNPGFDRQTPVVIAPTSNVRWDHVVNCWNAAVRAQCEKITFAGGD